MLKRIGKPYTIENVQGAIAQKQIRGDLVLRNLDFGLAAVRPRAFEASFPLVHEMDSRWLSQICCLGRRSRLPRKDTFGRKWWCCGGNIQPVYSTPAPGKGVTVEAWEEAMGVDAGSMTVEGLALSIHPVFAEYTPYQLVAHILNLSDWRVPVITYAEAKADPARAA
jgi:hypothetical protein